MPSSPMDHIKVLLTELGISTPSGSTIFIFACATVCTLYALVLLLLWMLEMIWRLLLSWPAFNATVNNANFCRVMTATALGQFCFCIVVGAILWPLKIGLNSHSLASPPVPIVAIPSCVDLSVSDCHKALFIIESEITLHETMALSLSVSAQLESNLVPGRKMVEEHLERQRADLKRAKDVLSAMSELDDRREAAVKGAFGRALQALVRVEWKQQRLVEGNRAAVDAEDAQGGVITTAADVLCDLTSVVLDIQRNFYGAPEVLAVGGAYLDNEEATNMTAAVASRQWFMRARAYDCLVVHQHWSCQFVEVMADKKQAAVRRMMDVQRQHSTQAQALVNGYALYRGRLGEAVEELGKLQKQTCSKKQRAAAAATAMATATVVWLVDGSGLEASGVGRKTDSRGLVAYVGEVVRRVDRVRCGIFPGIPLMRDYMSPY